MHDSCTISMHTSKRPNKCVNNVHNMQKQNTNSHLHRTSIFIAYFPSLYVNESEWPKQTDLSSVIQPAISNHQPSGAHRPPKSAAGLPTVGGWRAAAAGRLRAAAAACSATRFGQIRNRQLLLNKMTYICSDHSHMKIANPHTCSIQGIVKACTSGFSIKTTDVKALWD